MIGISAIAVAAATPTARFVKRLIMEAPLPDWRNLTVATDAGKTRLSMRAFCLRYHGLASAVRTASERADDDQQQQLPRNPVRPGDGLDRRDHQGDRPAGPFIHHLSARRGQRIPVRPLLCARGQSDLGPGRGADHAARERRGDAAVLRGHGGGDGAVPGLAARRSRRHSGGDVLGPAQMAARPRDRVGHQGRPGRHDRPRARAGGDAAGQDQDHLGGDAVQPDVAGVRPEGAGGDRARRGRAARAWIPPAPRRS